MKSVWCILPLSSPCSGWVVVPSAMLFIHSGFHTALHVWWAPQRFCMFMGTYMLLIMHRSVFLSQFSSFKSNFKSKLKETSVSPPDHWVFKLIMSHVYVVLYFLLNAMCRYLSLNSNTTKPIMCIQTLNTFYTKISKCCLLNISYILPLVQHL